MSERRLASTLRADRASWRRPTRLAAAALVGAAMTPTMAYASSGCTAINGGALNFSTVYSAGDLTSSGARFATNVSDQALSSLRTASAVSDPIAGAAAYDGGTYTFSPGDSIMLTATTTGYSGGTFISAAIRRGTGSSTAVDTAAVQLSSNNSISSVHTVTTSDTSIGVRVSRSGTPSGTVNVTVSCTPAVPTPTLTSFSFGTLVGYNSAGVVIDVRSSGAATNSPTGYGVSATAGGTFSNTAFTSGGGRVVIDGAGLATYRPLAGYRGTDTFFAVASNGGGSSAPAMVTVTVGNPTITASITGSGAKLSAPLAGYAITAAGGQAPYSCALSGGSAPLPAGVTLGANCALTGTPTVTGNFGFNVDVTDSSVTGPSGGTAQPFTATSVPITGFVIGLDPPTVTGISPNVGATTGGTTVVISGTGFANVGNVSFGGTPATSFTVNSPTQITATSPARSAGLADVTVTTSAGTSPANAAVQFTFAVTPTAPVITSPASGATIGTPTPTYGGTADPNGTVTVYVDGAAIGTAIASASGTWSRSQPTPLGPGPHTIYATATNGVGLTGPASSTQSFTIVPVPVASNSTTASVPYNDGSNTPWTVNVALHVTNGPTSFALSSPTTTNGGTVTITNSGLATFVLPAGFRGTDSFRYTASNAGGNSNEAVITIPVNNPTLTFGLAGSATRGVPLSGVQVTASGGKGPYGCATTPVSGSLPPGTTLNANCTITGTPTSGGNFTFAVSVTDSSTGLGPFTATSGNLTLVVAVPTMTVSPAAGTLPAATAQAPYSQSFTITGGTGPYTLALTGGALPNGLSISGTTLSGTPTVAGTFTFSLTATDSSGPLGPTPVTTNYTMTVGPPVIVVSTPSVSAGNLGTNYLALIDATGGTPAYSFSLASGSLPPGLTLASNGQISGTPTTTGSFTFSIRASDSTVGASGTFSAPRSYTITVGAPILVLSPAGVPGGQIGLPYSQSFTVSGGLGTTSFAVSSGALPAGLTLSADGTLSGTPTAAGSFAFTVTATNTPPGSSSYTVSQNYSINVTAPTLSIAPGGLPAATSGTAYSQAITVSGGTGPYSVAVTSGSLPAGLTLASNGTLSGSPTAVGTFAFSVTATDASTGAGAPFTASRAYSLTVNAPTITLNPATLPAGEAGLQYSQTLSATGGVGPHSFAVTAGALPTGWSLSPSGTLSGTTSQSGTFNFTITATDASTSAGAPFSASRNYSVTLATSAVGVSGPAMSAVVGTPYSGAFAASGGTAPYTYSVIAGTLPPGLTLASDGTLSGTPTAQGAATFTVRATDSNPPASGGPRQGQSAFTLNVAANPPVAQNVSATVAFGASAAPISPTLSGGPATTIAIVAAPAQGSVTVSGLSFSYTPNNGFFGADSFTYTATGPGGTSAAATVSITVGNPPAPVAGSRTGVAVPYGSAGTAIDLSSAVSGVRSGIAIATAPAHGTASIAGEVVTYTPAAGYFGADSFTYTATGPGGTSAPATVSLVVATPAAPVAANRTGVSVPYASSGTAIDLSGSVTGVSTGIAVTVAPTRGTVTVSGSTVTYTPNAGAFGADGFTYTATGPGGTSTPATVSLTIETPGAPTVAARAGVSVAFDSTGAAIDLTSSISGVYTAVAVATAPANGTASVSGSVVTYVPNAGYFGPDSFTVTATGPGGTSAPAAVTLTVATPPAPIVVNLDNVAIGYGSTGTSIDLSRAITGVYSSIAIATGPTKGSASITGSTATYTPAAGYYGADSFTIVATGPGGVSATGTISVAVATPPPPTTRPGASSVRANTANNPGGSVRIDLSALVSGVYDSIRIDGGPSNGRVVLEGGASGVSMDGERRALSVTRVIATYTPNVGFVGTDSFAFTAVGPGGQSQPSAVTITVEGGAPVALAKTAVASDGEAVTVDLTAGAEGGPFTGATVVGMTPAGAANATIVASGSGTAQTYSLTITPKHRFGGTVVVQYTLSNAFGASAPATVTLTVTARPDPTKDPNVRALSDAQAEATRRFGRAQVTNFLRRAEQLHHGGGSPRPSFGITLAARDLGSSRPDQLLPGQEDPAGDRQQRAAAPAEETTQTKSEAAEEPDGAGGRRIGSIALWTGGAIDIGTRDATSDRTKITATTSGLSGGADLKLGEGAFVGVGGGYGMDVSRIGGGAARVRSESSLFAGYASLMPIKGLFVDAVMGLGKLSFDTRRMAAETGTAAMGRRDGSYTLGAVSIGIDRAGGPIRWSLYGRGEFMAARLDAYVEWGAGRYDLRFDERDLRSLTGTLGGWIETERRVGASTMTPRLRFEWNHEFEDGGAQWLDYADIPGASLYRIDMQRWRRNQFQLTVGSKLATPTGWAFELESGARFSTGELAAMLRFMLSKNF